MSEKRISNYPEMLSGEGVARLWRAVLTQALEDLQTDRYRYDAAQWLCGSDSDLCWMVLGVDPPEIRKRIAEQYTERKAA